MENKFKEKVMMLYKDKRGIEDAFKYLIMTFIFASLFAMIIFTVIIAQGNQYGKDSSEVIGNMNVNALNGTVNGYQEQAYAWKNAMSGSNSSNILTQAIGDVSTALNTVGFIASSMFNLVLTPFTYLAGISIDVLGVPGWIIGVFMAIVIIASIFGLIRLYKWGS